MALNIRTTVTVAAALVITAGTLGFGRSDEHGMIYVRRDGAPIAPDYAATELVG